MGVYQEQDAGSGGQPPERGKIAVVKTCENQRAEIADTDGEKLCGEIASRSLVGDGAKKDQGINGNRRDQNPKQLVRTAEIVNNTFSDFQHTVPFLKQENRRPAAFPDGRERDAPAWTDIIVMPL